MRAPRRVRITSSRTSVLRQPSPLPKTCPAEKNFESLYREMSSSREEGFGWEVCRILHTSIDWVRWVACWRCIDLWVPTSQQLDLLECLMDSLHLFSRKSNQQKCSSQADDCMVWNCRWNFLLLLLLLGRVSNAPHFIVDVVVCDFQCRYNFSSHVDQIFDEASLAASIVHSNMSDYFSCIQFDHQISHLAAKFIKLPILSSFVGIILPLAAILSRWMHGDSVPFDCSAKDTRQWECGNGVGGAQIASDSNKNSSLKIFHVCKSCV